MASNMASPHVAPEAQPTAILTPTPAPTATSEPAATPEPTATSIPAASGLVGGPAAQAAELAARDGVHPVVGELSFADRVSVNAEVIVDGEQWVVSTLPVPTRISLSAASGGDRALDLAYGEILRLDGEQIVQAIPMFGTPGTWIAASDRAVYAGRHGDGAAPHDAVVRVATTTNEISKLLLPFTYSRADLAYFEPSDWQIVRPQSRRALQRAVNNVTDEVDDGLTALDEAIDQSTFVDAADLPTLGGHSPACDTELAKHYLDFGTHCAIERGGRCTTCTSLIESGDQTLAGRLVGGGSMNSTGSDYVAIAGPITEDATTAPLVFAPVDNLDDWWDTGIYATGPTAGDLVSVSFFDGGFATTSFVRTGGQDHNVVGVIRGYDNNAEQLSGFTAPVTLVEEGKIPDLISRAAVAPDGATIAVVTQISPTSAPDAITTRLTVHDTSTGAELSRVDYEEHEHTLAPSWLDFDGRWALLTIDAAEAWQPAMLFDTQTEEVYPLGSTGLIQTLPRGLASS